MLLHLTVHHHHENVFGVGHYPKRNMRDTWDPIELSYSMVTSSPNQDQQSHPARPNLDQLTSTNPQK